MYTAGNHAVWGNVDLLSKRENKIVQLTKPVSFKKENGTTIILKKGTILNWEGFYLDQNFLSQRYLIEGSDSFETLHDAGMTGKFLYQEIKSSENTEELR